MAGEVTFRMIHAVANSLVEGMDYNELTQLAYSSIYSEMDQDDEVFWQYAKLAGLFTKGEGDDSDDNDLG